MVFGKTGQLVCVLLCRRDRRHGKPGGLLHKICRCGWPGGMLHLGAGYSREAAVRMASATEAAARMYRTSWTRTMWAPARMEAATAAAVA